ncbi:hypothetical protein EJB05_48301, partial [Eragrostis curvula]
MAARFAGAIVAKQGRNTRSGNRKYSGPKNLGWMGARPRLGRWASELRLKCKRQRLWIGTFATPEQAALAYDAAIYCIYGNDIPRSRRFNFPYMPRPNVSEEARAAGIPNANIRAIAEKHARSLAVYVEPPPLPQLPVLPVAAAPPLMVAPIPDPGNGMTIEEFFNSFSPEEFDAMMANISLL